MRENEEDNEFNEDNTIERSKIIYSEAINMLNSLELFFLQQDKDCNNCLKYINTKKRRYFLLNKKI